MLLEGSLLRESIHRQVGQRNTAAEKHLENVEGVEGKVLREKRIEVDAVTLPFISCSQRSHDGVTPRPTVAVAHFRFEELHERQIVEGNLEIGGFRFGEQFAPGAVLVGDAGNGQVEEALDQFGKGRGVDIEFVDVELTEAEVPGRHLLKSNGVVDSVLNLCR